MIAAIIAVLCLFVLSLIVKVYKQNKLILTVSENIYKILNDPTGFKKDKFIELINRHQEIMNLVCSHYKSVNKRSMLSDASKVLSQDEYYSLLEEFESCV